jgi:UDP-glucose 4-epimerase
MAKYLVTGAAGFIGSALAGDLIKERHEVWTIDNLSTGKKDNLPAGIHFIQGGCEEEKSISQLNKTKFDAVFHLAAQSSGED